MANRRRIQSSPGAPADAADASSAGRNKKARKTVDLGWSSKKKKDGHLDDMIDSSSDEDNDQKARLDQDDDEDEEEEETLDAKKIRLARQYLEKLESEDDDESSGDEDCEDGEDLDKDRLGRKLQLKRMKRQGTLEYAAAKRIVQDFDAMHLPPRMTETATTTAANETEILEHAKAWHDAGRIQYFRGHDLTPTCVALQQITGEKAISGSKDHSVWWWDVETGQKISQLCAPWKHETKTVPYHHKHATGGAAKATADSRNAGQVLAVACSDDGRYAAVGKRDATVTIFDVRIASKQQQQQQQQASVVTTFTGHKGPVTCLTFRTQSRQLFSGSEDRCIRHYNLDEMLYVETLYGHQFGVTAMDCHRQELPVSVGRDRTARVWKLAEDSHLIFRGGAKVASAEAVSVIQDDWFLTGHEDGHLALWMSGRKRPVTSIDHAHGLRTNNDTSSSDGTLEPTTTTAADTMFGNGIASLAALKNSDVAATGSNDGYLRLWKVATGKTLAERGMEPLAKIPVFGYINGVAIGPKAKFCVVAVGQEPRLGRWNRIPKAKNRFGIIRLRAPQDGQDEDEDEVVDEETTGQSKSTTVTTLRKPTKEDSSNDDDISAES